MTGPQRYVRTPDALDAIQWTDDDSARAIMAWAAGVVSVQPSGQDGRLVGLRIDNPRSGPLWAAKGEYVCRYASGGRFFPVSQAAFEATYVAPPREAGNVLAAWDAREAVGQAYADAALRGGPDVDDDAWLNAEDALSSAMEELRSSLGGGS